MQQNRADSRRWEVGVRTAHGSLVTLQLLLPDRFPNEAPVVHIVERGVVHSWLDRDQRVVGCHALNTWSCVTSDPGEVGGCPPPHTHTHCLSTSMLLTSHSISFTRAQGVPRYKTGLGGGVCVRSVVGALTPVWGPHLCPQMP